MSTGSSEVTYYEYNNLNQFETEIVLGGDTTDYTRTADGEMATKHEAAGWTYYTWDVAESLKKIEAPNVTLESKYNSRMQRVWRSEDGAAEKLIYDTQKLVAEVAGEGISRYYLSEGGGVYSPLVSQSGSQHWFLSDALGTTVGLTDGGGGLSDTFLYEAFGTSLGRTGATATPYQYVGGYGYFNEPGAGLEQVWWRWYPPAGGQYTSGGHRGSTRYAYALGKPAELIDGTGRGRPMGGGFGFINPDSDLCRVVRSITSLSSPSCLNCGCQIAGAADVFAGGGIEVVDCICNLNIVCSASPGTRPVSEMATVFDCLSFVGDGFGYPWGMNIDGMALILQQIEQGWPLLQVGCECMKCFTGADRDWRGPYTPPVMRART